MSSREFNRATTLLQKLVRLKAADDWGFCTCILCGQRCDYRDAHGAHFIPRSCKRYALTPANLNCCCRTCNCDDPDHAKKYEAWMIDTYGPEYVEHLKATSRGPFRWSRAELLALQDEFKAQIKEQEARLGLRGSAA